MDKQLHKKYYRPLITSKPTVERFEQTIQNLMFGKNGQRPYTEFILVLDQFCCMQSLPRPIQEEQHELFCALMEWCFVGLAPRITNLCDTHHNWDFWEKLGRNRKDGGYKDSTFSETKRIIPSSTETETAAMNPYTHDQYFLAIMNDQFLPNEMKQRVAGGNDLHDIVAYRCRNLAKLHGLKPLSRQQVTELCEALEHAFTKPTPTPTPKEEPIMSNKTPAFQTKHFVDGVDATLLNDDSLISTIKRLETEIDELAKVKTSSKRILARINELHDQLKAIAALLDARTP